MDPPDEPHAPVPARRTNTPSPKAANPANFWRDIARRVSLRHPLPAPDHHHPAPRPPHPHPPPPPPATALVEINLHNRDPDDAVRKHPNDPVNASAFDDLPPPELYDPAWNTLPLRCEAGRLGPDHKQPNGPLLPTAFTINSSDLDDDDDGDDDDGHPDDDADDDASDPDSTSRPERRAAPTRPPFPELPPIRPAPATRDTRDPDLPHPSPRARRSVVWKRVAAAPVAVSQRLALPAPRRAGVFESPLSPKATADDLTVVIERHLRGELVAVKPAEIRARVPLAVNDAPTTCNIVVAMDDRPGFCRVSIRRTFADSFRISNEDFDWFCAEFAARFRELQQLAASR